MVLHCLFDLTRKQLQWSSDFYRIHGSHKNTFGFAVPYETLCLPSV